MTTTHAFRVLIGRCDKRAWHGPQRLTAMTRLSYNANNNDSHKEWCSPDIRRIRPDSLSSVTTSASTDFPTGRPVPQGRALSLADLAARQVTTISALVEAPGDTAVLQRLTELGFMVGETVSVLRRGPGGREPIAVQVGDTVFALRRHEASCIQVRPPA